MSSTLFVTGVTASSAAWANDADTSVYNYLSSVSGTNTITATGPTSMTAYAAGQMFKLVPAATNTGATTISINAIGNKNIYANGAVLTGGEFVVSVPVLIVYDGTQFNICGLTLSATRVIPSNSNSADYTTVLTDGGKSILHPASDANDRTFTIDSNANVAYPVGTILTFINMAAANIVSIAITSDTMYLANAGTTGTRSLAPYGIAVATKVTSTTWIVSGTGLA